MYVCMYVYVCIYIYVCMYVSMYVCMYVFMYVCMYVRCVCMRVYLQLECFTKTFQYALYQAHVPRMYVCMRVCR